MPIILVGLNHHTASVSLRESFYFDVIQSQKMMRFLTNELGYSEAVVFSTCNRTEFYVVGDSPKPLIHSIELHCASATQSILPSLYLKQEEEAAAHLFEVACGLDSLVLGETQILGQLGDALESAQKIKTTGRILNVLFQTAQSTGRRVFSQTQLSSGASSVGRVAADVAVELFSTLVNQTALIIGAGETAHLVAKHLASRGIRTIFVANRTHEHAVQLASELNGEAVFFADIPEYLTRVDIVISSTSAPHTVIHHDMVERCMRTRDGKPIFFIDIALPRDVEDSVRNIPNITLYNVDDLRKHTQSHLEKREGEIPRAREILVEELQKWRLRHSGLAVAPIIAKLHQRFETIRTQECNLSATPFTNLSDETKQEIERITRSIVAKLLHQPTVALKEMALENSSTSTMVSRLFGLSETEQTSETHKDSR